MLPYLEFLGVRIPVYGLMSGLGILAMFLVLDREGRRRGFPRDYEIGVIFSAMVGGFVGGRLVYLFQYWDTALFPRFAYPDGPTWDQILDAALWNRANLVWNGSFLGMLAAALIYAHVRRLPKGKLLDASVIGLAAMHVFGRLGCHLSGDGCYGVPTELPWPFSVSYANGILPTPAGVRVHPTPIYEALLLMAIALVLWRLRHRRWPAGTLFAAYLILDGLERFGLEFLRREPYAAWPPLQLTHAQWFAVAYVVGGTAWIVAMRRRQQRDAWNAPAWQTDATAGDPPGTVAR